MCKKIKLRISQKQIFRIFAKRCCISSLNLRMCKNNFAGRKLQKKTTIFAQVFGSKKPMEREGFEPPVPFGTAVFKTAVIDHSTISP